MDPQANLREQAEIAAKIIAASDAGYSLYENPDMPDMVDRLAELVTAYCEWIAKGGSPK